MKDIHENGITVVPIKKEWSDAEEARRVNEFMGLHEASGVQESVDNFNDMMGKLNEDKTEYNLYNFPVLNTHDDRIEYLANSICTKKIYNLIIDLVSKDVKYLDDIDIFKRDAKAEAIAILEEANDEM